MKMRAYFFRIRLRDSRILKLTFVDSADRKPLQKHVKWEKTMGADVFFATCINQVEPNNNGQLLES